MIQLELTREQRAAWNGVMRDLAVLGATRGQRALSSALRVPLREFARPGRNYLRRNTPRGRDPVRVRIGRRFRARIGRGEAVAPTTRKRLYQSVGTRLKREPDGNTSVYIGWRIGQSTGISRYQTLAVEFGTRTQAARRVVAEAARISVERSDPDELLEVLQREADKAVDKHVQRQLRLNRRR